MKNRNNPPSEADVMRMVLDRIDRLDDKLEEKLNKVEDRLDVMDKTLIKQEANLEAHMKRSDLLEQSQDDLKDAVKPLLKVYTVVWGLCKLALAVGFLLSLLGGTIKLVGLIK